MTRILNKIKDAKDDLVSINSNFDRLALDIANASGSFSSVASLSGTTIAPAGIKVIEVSIIDGLNLYTIDRLPIIPRVQLFIGTDNDDAYLWPGGTSLGFTERDDIEMTVFVARKVVNLIGNEKATHYIRIKNHSATVTYTLYLYNDVFYVPTPESGAAQGAS